MRFKLVLSKGRRAIPSPELRDGVIVLFLEMCIPCLAQRQRGQVQSHLKAPFHSIYEIRKAGHRHLLPAASYLPPPTCPRGGRAAPGLEALRAGQSALLPPAGPAGERQLESGC